MAACNSHCSMTFSIIHPRCRKNNKIHEVFLSFDKEQKIYKSKNRKLLNKLQK